MRSPEIESERAVDSKRGAGSLNATSDWVLGIHGGNDAAGLHDLPGSLASAVSESRMFSSSVGNAAEDGWTVYTTISRPDRSITFTIRGSDMVASYARAERRFEEGIRAISDARVHTRVANGRLQLWAVFKEEPILSTKLRVAEVFQNVYQMEPMILYDFLIITDQEYAWRTNK